MNTKNLIFIGGPNGVGKSTVCHELHLILPDAVWFDGDWAWSMDPPIETDKTKAMVIDNIAHILNNFISIPEFKNIIFCWLLNEDDVYHSIITRLNSIESCNISRFSLICKPDILELRVRSRTSENKNSLSQVRKSIDRLSSFSKTETDLIDTSKYTLKQTCLEIIRKMEMKGV